MTDDIGMFSTSKMETYRDASRVAIGIGVWDIRNASGVGESDPNRGTGIIEMRSCCKLLHFF